MKKSFTLIEIMLSIIILSVLILAMNNIIVNLLSTKTFLKNKVNKDNKNELLIKTLYYDILNAKDLSIRHSFNSNYDVIYMQTQNSLYHLINPFVIWYVSKNNDSLIRIESPFKIKLPTNKAFFLDKFKSNVKIFKIFCNGMKKFIFIKINNINLYFEIVSQIYNKKIIIKNIKNKKKSKNISLVKKSLPKKTLLPIFH